MIADAFETFHEQMVPDLGDLSVRNAIVLLLGHVAEVVVDSTFSRCIPALIEGAERDERVREFHHRYGAERRQAIIDLIARGIREGKIKRSVDPELATITLLGAIFYRRLMTAEPFRPDDAGGARARPNVPRRRPDALLEVLVNHRAAPSRSVGRDEPRAGALSRRVLDLPEPGRARGVEPG